MSSCRASQHSFLFVIFALNRQIVVGSPVHCYNTWEASRRAEYEAFNEDAHLVG